MKDNRQIVCDIISEMLDNPDEHGIYPTTEAYNKLEDKFNLLDKQVHDLTVGVCDYATENIRLLGQVSELESIIRNLKPFSPIPTIKEIESYWKKHKKPAKNGVGS